MWGVVPAAGAGSRIQPLAFSKELLPVGSCIEDGVERPRAVCEYILERMIQALENGGRVELRGFGALSVRARDARAGRNPRTGEPVDVRAKHVPFFKSGKELRERLNADDEG